jgi:hypothetical protein
MSFVDEATYNPILWVLYSVCRYLHDQKLCGFTKREVKIQDYYVMRQHWLPGSFSDIRDIIAVDNVTTLNPITAVATLYAPDIQDLTLVNSLIDKKTLYIIPVEWIQYIAARDGCFVLLPFKFCCREVLLRTTTQMVRCQSLSLEPHYLVDETYFHVKMIVQNDFMNAAEMLYGVGRYEPTLIYYTQTNDQVLKKGSEIKGYLAHILVCKRCNKYLLDFLQMLDQSVAHHPYPQHTEVSKDRLNDEGIPIFEYVLDADFDVLRYKAYYGLTNEVDLNICEIVVTFMSTYRVS